MSLMRFVLMVFPNVVLLFYPVLLLLSIGQIRCGRIPPDLPRPRNPCRQTRTLSSHSISFKNALLYWVLLPSSLCVITADGMPVEPVRRLPLPLLKHPSARHARLVHSTPHSHRYACDFVSSRSSVVLSCLQPCGLSTLGFSVDAEHSAIINELGIFTFVFRAL